MVNAKFTLRPHFRLLRVVVAPCAALASFTCASFTAPPPDAPGGVERPIRCATPEGQRRYLKRLRGAEDRALEYEYVGPILGPSGVVLDQFDVENPAPDARSAGAAALDAFRSRPERPDRIRIYMNLYVEGCETAAPPGFRLSGESPDDLDDLDAADSPDAP